MTGAWKGTSTDKLYKDLGWETLSNRRIQRKLTILYEIQKDAFPNYLVEILEPQKYNDASRMANQKILKTIPCRLNRYKSSFFPSTINDWNNLDLDVKKYVSKNVFKKNTKFDQKKVHILGYQTKNPN